MPWSVKHVEDQRGHFVIRALEPEANISELCRMEGISRPTAYEWIRRYKSGGFGALKDRSRRAHRLPRSSSAEVVMEIVNLRTQKPTWGGRKIRARLVRMNRFKHVPKARSIDRILKRCGLVNPRMRSTKSKLAHPTVVAARRPNHVWTIDFKGWWITRDGTRCEPLTIRDEHSKYIIGIFALRRTTFEAVKACLIKSFQRYGLPEYIRCDNGHPFISTQAICGLTRLSAWWIKLGITPNRIPPASPGMNGGHERMHRDLKKELQQNPARNLREEQERFDDWRHEFNHIRPHESLDDNVPDDWYVRSSRRYDAREREYVYPADFEVRKVTRNGEISWFGRFVGVSKSLAGEYVGIERLDDPTVRVWYTNFCLGVSDRSLQTPIIPAMPRKNREPARTAA